MKKNKLYNKSQLVEISQSEKFKTKTQEIEGYVSLLLTHPGNVELFLKIKTAINSQGEINESVFNENFTRENYFSYVIVKHLDDFVFDVIQALLMYPDQYSKCLNYVKASLKLYGSLNFLSNKSLILDCMNDQDRFETDSVNLKLLRHELENLKYQDLGSVTPLNCGMIEYFTGVNRTRETEKILKTFAQARGLVITKEQEIKQYFEEYKEKFMMFLKKESASVNRIVKAVKPKKEKHLQAPVLALFCQLIRDAKIDPMKKNEAIEVYCERICIKFGLPFSDRVRQNFSDINLVRNKRGEIETLLQSIPNPEVSKALLNYLHNKYPQNPTSQNLYA